MKPSLAFSLATAVQLLALFIASTVLILGGCRPPGPNYKELELVEVTGNVTMDGQPLPDVTVRFEGPPGRFADGKTDASGNFRLMYDSNQAGCTPGEKIVRIVSGSLGEGSEEGSPVEGSDGKVVPAVQTIPAAYNTASQLKENVSPSNKTFTFNLVSRP